MVIADNISSIKSTLPDSVTLVAVSKTKPNIILIEAYNAGQRIFGENKVQELVGKEEALPKDIKWHMIGHLQSNKVKYIAPFVHLIHGVDSGKLLKEINKQGKKNNRVVNVLLQVHIATEESKFGFSQAEINDLLQSPAFAEWKNVEVCGLMGMASNTKDVSQVAKEFTGLKLFFDELKGDVFSNRDQFKELSMGMSGDYKIAIQHGSSMIRVGSSIFGIRQ